MLPQPHNRPSAFLVNRSPLTTTCSHYKSRLPHTLWHFLSLPILCDSYMRQNESQHITRFYLFYVSAETFVVHSTTRSLTTTSLFTHLANNSHFRPLQFLRHHLHADLNRLRRPTHPLSSHGFSELYTAPSSDSAPSKLHFFTHFLSFPI